MADYWNVALQGQSQNEVNRESQRDAMAAEKPTSHEIAALEKAKSPKPPLGPNTDFTRLLAKHRDMFQGMIFMDETPNADKGWMMLYATQQPLRILFVAVTPAAPHLPDPPRGIPLHRVADHAKFVGRFEWTWRPGAFFSDEMFAGDDLNNIWVFQDIMFKGADRVLTHMAPVPLQDFSTRCVTLIGEFLFG